LTKGLFNYENVEMFLTIKLVKLLLRSGVWKKFATGPALRIRQANERCRSLVLNLGMGRVTVTTQSSENGALALSRMSFSGCVSR